MLSLFATTEPSRTFSETSTQLKSLLKNEKVLELVDGGSVESQIRLKQWVGLVLGSDTVVLASDPDLKNSLKNIEIDRHVDEFVKYLKTNKTL